MRSGWGSRGLLLAGVCAAALLLLPASRLLAAAKPAEVTLLEGEAAAEAEGGEKIELKRGSGVAQGHTVTTAEGARLELQFADKSVLRLGPSAKLTLTALHFGGPAKRKMTAKLWFGSIWAKVTRAVQGEQKFQIETENAVAGVRGTTFRVDARADKSVLVRVYAGAVAVAKNTPVYADPDAKPGERREVQGPDEVSREQWEHVVGKQMEIVIAADGTPGAPTAFSPASEKDDAWVKWNEKRDSRRK